MRQVYSTWYRSILRDGSLWCETSNPKEVVKMSEGKDVIFQKLVTYLTDDGWEGWNP